VFTYRRRAFQFQTNSCFLFSKSLAAGLARETAEKFRVNKEEREIIIDQVTKVVSHWHEEAGKMDLSRGEIQQMENAFLSK